MEILTTEKSEENQQLTEHKKYVKSGWFKYLFSSADIAPVETQHFASVDFYTELKAQVFSVVEKVLLIGFESKKRK